MTDFSMKLHGVWANFYVGIRFFRCILQEDCKELMRGIRMEGFKFEYRDIKGFSYKHPKVIDFL